MLITEVKLTVKNILSSVRPAVKLKSPTDGHNSKAKKTIEINIKINISLFYYMPFNQSTKREIDIRKYL